VRGTRAEARAHLQTPVEGLATEDLGVDGALEFRQTVEALLSRPTRQPIQVAIEPSDVTVCACRDVDDDLPRRHDISHFCASRL
jgi:hypothetical protein